MRAMTVETPGPSEKSAVSPAQQTQSAAGTSEVRMPWEQAGFAYRKNIVLRVARGDLLTLLTQSDRTTWSKHRARTVQCNICLHSRHKNGQAESAEEPPPQRIAGHRERLLRCRIITPFCNDSVTNTRRCDGRPDHAIGRRLNVFTTCFKTYRASGSPEHRKWRGAYLDARAVTACDAWQREKDCRRRRL